MDTPLLLIAWRRPGTLGQVINAIRPVAPTRIFVACDGPCAERPGEVEKVASTRALIEHEIDWPCHIERFYSDVNQGCRLGVSRAITWFFELVDEGIILEDDCIPNPDFFPYCATLLERYRHDMRVWCIAGDNATSIQSSLPKYSYSYTGYPLIWGWATWKSRWDYFSLEYPYINEISSSYGLSTPLFSFDKYAARQRFSYWKKISAGMGPDSWAAAWAYTCMTNSGLTIIPRVNLIQNVGFGTDSTHTTNIGGSRDSAITFNLSSLNHPQFVLRDFCVDKRIVKDIYGYSLIRQSYLYRFLRKLASLFLCRLHHLPFIGRRL